MRDHPIEIVLVAQLLPLCNSPPQVAAIVQVNGVSVDPDQPAIRLGQLHPLQVPL